MEECSKRDDKQNINDGEKNNLNDSFIYYMS